MNVATGKDNGRKLRKPSLPCATRSKAEDLAYLLFSQLQICSCELRRRYYEDVGCCDLNRGGTPLQHVERAQLQSLSDIYCDYLGTRAK